MWKTTKVTEEEMGRFKHVGDTDGNHVLHETPRLRDHAKLVT